MSGREFTGRHALMVFGGMFAVIIAVNMVMMVSALRTFPGVTEENGYVASQHFDELTAAQEALGWQSAIDYGRGALAVRVTGQDGTPVRDLAMSAVVGLPATGAEDRRLTLREEGGLYLAPVALEPGRWRVEITASDAMGNAYRAAAQVRVGREG